MVEIIEIKIGASKILSFKKQFLQGDKKMLAPIVEIFCEIDDFCKQFKQWQNGRILPNPDRQRQRECNLAASEVMTIVVLFHLSHYRTFKDFYIDSILCGDLRMYFPRAVSYNRFVELQHSVIILLVAYLLAKQGEETGLYYVDSTPLKICNNRRIYRNKVFRGIAERGKHSMGWFFGFKLHLVINHKGELMSFCFTKGNVDDRKTLLFLFQKLKGIAAGDKGYICKKEAVVLESNGLKLITKVRKNMKEKALSILEKHLLSKRGIVETVIDQLKSLCQIEHTRHRSPLNFISNFTAALAAYVLRPRKPTVRLNLLRCEHLLTSN